MVALSRPCGSYCSSCRVGPLDQVVPQGLDASHVVAVDLGLVPRCLFKHVQPVLLSVQAVHNGGQPILDPAQSRYQGIRALPRILRLTESPYLMLLSWGRKFQPPSVLANCIPLA